MLGRTSIFTYLVVVTIMAAMVAAAGSAQAKGSPSGKGNGGSSQVGSDKVGGGKPDDKGGARPPQKPMPHHTSQGLTSASIIPTNGAKSIEIILRNDSPVDTGNYAGWLVNAFEVMVYWLPSGCSVEGCPEGWKASFRGPVLVFSNTVPPFWRAVDDGGNAVRPGGDLGGFKISNANRAIPIDPDSLAITVQVGHVDEDGHLIELEGLEAMWFDLAYGNVSEESH